MAIIIRVIDVETTGTPPGHAVCEIGWSDLIIDPPGYWKVSPPLATLCNPGRAIPPEAMAVHHITDADVRHAPTPDAAFLAMMSVHGAPNYWCAHNAAFEREFFGGGDIPWICTLKGARRAWPDAPNHSNQTLRYWLDLGLNAAWAMPPHRAGPDAYVTAMILSELLNEAPLEKLVEWTKQPSLLTNVTFGKHRGEKWSALPRDYLQWIASKSDLGPDEKYTAKYYLKGAHG